jgi:4-hydroxy-tetrahydrodipicolinate reductase
MSPVRCGVTGALGRRGSAIARQVLASDEFALFGATERHDHPDIAKDVGALLGVGNLDLFLENELVNCILATDVIIDFTWPDASMEHLKVAVEKQKAIVIGTTGFSAEQKGQIAELAPQTRALLAPNMALGVNVLFYLAGVAAKLLDTEFDCEIVEMHHRRKLDAPSGTALEIGRRVAAAWDADLDEVRVDGRRGQVGERPIGQIGFHAVRGGDVVGEHELIFAGPGERLSISHRAENRENFVRGALRAAMFLSRQTEPGLYTMADVLRLPDRGAGR